MTARAHHRNRARCCVQRSAEGGHELGLCDDAIRTTTNSHEDMDGDAEGTDIQTLSDAWICMLVSWRTTTRADDEPSWYMRLELALLQARLSR